MSNNLRGMKAATSVLLLLILTHTFSSLAMAGSFEHLRRSLCSFSASHLGSLAQSSAMNEIELYYRGLAISGMAAELERARSSPPCRSSSLGDLLDSAILMAWYSKEP